MKKTVFITAALMAAILSACGGDSLGTGTGTEAEHGTDHGTDHGANHGTDDGANGSAHETERGSAPNGEESDAAHSDDHGDHGTHGDQGGNPEEAGKLRASFVFDGGTPKANEAVELSIAFANEQGQRVTDFEISHEKLLHLIIVDHDLTFFNHIHPEAQADGTFRIETTFPSGGEYKLFADVVPAGGSGVTISERIEVEGAEKEHVDVVADEMPVKQAGGKEVELFASSLKATEEVLLTFEVRDAATKQGIDDLEPYLGAVGHVVILSADAEKYIHVHPLDETATGPKAEFATVFPEAGLYKVWGQFQHHGEVFTVSYVIEVE